MNEPAFPLGKQYSIILADPPWRYRDAGCNGAAEDHYSTMALAAIKELPVSQIAAPDCALFFWATFPLLPEALEVITAWGFTYKSIAFNWIKLNRRSPTPFYGLGRWTRGNTEPCLLAIKGKPKRVDKSISQLIIEPVTRHSAKPAIVRERIVKLMGNQPRIELFARSKTDGWDVWGNQADGASLAFKKHPDQLCLFQ